MTNQEFLIRFADINQPMTVNPIRFSTIGILLRSARKLSGRDLETGLYVMNELNEDNFTDQTYHSNLFTSLISYLIFLEQVGSIFKFTTNKKNGIHIALENFSSLSEKQIFAIRALRNSLTHNYGLATEITENNSNKRYKFTLSLERNSNIIELPSRQWNGDFIDKNEDTNTIVFVIDLCNLIEDVYSKLITEIRNKNIEVALLNGIDELKARFTIIH